MSYVLPAFPAKLPIQSRFRLVARCLNCHRNSETVLPVPRADEAPADVDELLDSAYFQRLGYACKGCEGTIAVLISATPEYEPEEA